MQKLIKANEARSKKINKIEKIKDTKSISQAMEDLKTYASLGYDAISKEDFAYYFKCFGVFDKSKENGKNSFMIRVRIAGGQLYANQARVLGEVARDYGKNNIDITTRMQVELRYLTIEDLPIVLEKLDSVGLSTYQTGIDNIRNILTDPLDGVACDNIIESMPILNELQKTFFKVEEDIGKLPRKFNTAISGSLANRCNIIGHDCCFYLAQKDSSYGFNVALGGKVGEVAEKADVFLKDSDEVVLFFTHLVKIFKAYGFRDNRTKNRLFFLIKEVGMDALIEAIEESASYTFATAGEEVLEREMFNANDGSIVQKNGSCAMHMVIPAGLFKGTAMIKVAKLAQSCGDGRIRITYEQNLFILGVKDKEVCLSADIFREYKNIDTPYINNLITCIGQTNCQYGVINTKSTGKALSAYLDKEVKLPNDAVVRLYFSGCLKGCGLNGLADIGFEGTKAKDAKGNICEGVHITLGGKMTKETKEGRILFKKAPLEDAKTYVKSLMLMYRDEREEGESFEAYDDRVLSLLSVDEIVERIKI